MSMKHASFNNQIVALLERHSHHQLIKHIDFVELITGQQLNMPGQLEEYAYFPGGGVIALVMQQPSEKAIALTLVGLEGMVSIASVLGTNIVPYALRVLLPCRAMRISVEHLYALKLKNTDFSMIVDRYVAVMHTQFAQGIVCHSQHNVQQRMASLLLTYSDRVPAEDFEMTQSLMACLLGVRRSGVNKAACNLQVLQALQYSRGHINILDRAALLNAACPCYLNDKQVYEAMLKNS